MSKGPIALEGTEVSVHSEHYTTILGEGLIPAGNKAIRERWTLQHDNAPIHIAAYTCLRLGDNDVQVLDWPARSPDLNIIKRVWEMVVRSVYKNGKRYKSKKQLRDAVFNAFMTLSLDYIRSIFKFRSVFRVLLYYSYYYFPLFV